MCKPFWGLILIVWALLGTGCATTQAPKQPSLGTKPRHPTSGPSWRLMWRRMRPVPSPDILFLSEGLRPEDTRGTWEKGRLCYVGFQMAGGWPT